MARFCLEARENAKKHTACLKKPHAKTKVSLESHNDVAIIRIDNAFELSKPSFMSLVVITAKVSVYQTSKEYRQKLITTPLNLHKSFDF